MTKNPPSGNNRPSPPKRGLGPISPRQARPRPTRDGPWQRVAGINARSSGDSPRAATTPKTDPFIAFRTPAQIGPAYRSSQHRPDTKRPLRTLAQLVARATLSGRASFRDLHVALHTVVVAQ